jgi:hypothetical protein
VTQPLPLQQPPSQAVPLQTHWPFTHCWPEVQRLPPEPQLHAPFTQRSASSGSQLEQAPPFGPHCVALGAVTHVEPAQQPFGQVVALQMQAVPWQTLPEMHAGAFPHSQPPSTQASDVPEQGPQALPPSPHAALDSCASRMHCPAEQQPWGQLSALQTHVPPTHA